MVAGAVRVQLALHKRKRGDRPGRDQRGEHVTGGPEISPAAASGHCHVPEKAAPRYRLADLGRRPFDRLGRRLKTFDGPDHQAWAEETSARATVRTRLFGPGTSHCGKGRRRVGDLCRAQIAEEPKCYVPLAFSGPTQAVYGRPRQSGKS